MTGTAQVLRFYLKRERLFMKSYYTVFRAENCIITYKNNYKKELFYEIK